MRDLGWNSALPRHSGVPDRHLPPSPTAILAQFPGAVPLQSAAMVTAPRKEAAPDQKYHRDLQSPHRKTPPPQPEPALPRSRDGAGRGHAGLFCSLAAERRRARGLGRGASFFNLLASSLFLLLLRWDVHSRPGFPSLGGTRDFRRSRAGEPAPPPCWFSSASVTPAGFPGCLGI